MNDVYLPYINKSAPPRKIVIDPITRIEGHLRIEAQVAGGQVHDAWSAGTMFRGFEMIMRGRDPRDAWVFAQRLCGVCTHVHAICSVRAVEHALGITVPENARLIRNLLTASQMIHDHVIHFYHLHALDWVDLTGALAADPGATSRLAQSISVWPNASAEWFTTVQQRLQTFADSGQLGPFTNAYWGHPAYHLPPEANLLLMAHYLESLDWQREYIKIQTMLGGKNPHPQTYLVGGMATRLHALDANRLHALAAQALTFVQHVYIPDLLLLAAAYPEWTSRGGGARSYLSFGDFPTSSAPWPAGLWWPAGVVWERDLTTAPHPVDPAHITEYVTHSWYSYPEGDGVGKHPLNSETQPHYTGPEPPYDELNTDGKYSWLKSPRYQDTAMEVGPLARLAVGYAAGDQRLRTVTDQYLNHLGWGHAALFSTMGRMLARGIETLVIAEQHGTWIDQLAANIARGDLAIHNGTQWEPSSWPAEATGWGTTEAPRGALGHWVHIRNGTIAKYQQVVPSTWNGSPRDAQGQRGAWEEALVGTSIADEERPLEILRTVHSFDPCMGCAVHLIDSQGNDMVTVTVVEDATR
jgi:Ni,Fe-hydrogenase I large subunit